MYSDQQSYPSSARTDHHWTAATIGRSKSELCREGNASVEVLSRVVSLVWRYMKARSLQLQDVYVLVSSDSDFAIRKIRKAFPTNTYVANDFPMDIAQKPRFGRLPAGNYIQNEPSWI